MQGETTSRPHGLDHQRPSERRGIHKVDYRLVVKSLPQPVQYAQDWLGWMVPILVLSLVGTGWMRGIGWGGADLK